MGDGGFACDFNVFWLKMRLQIRGWETGELGKVTLDTCMLYDYQIKSKLSFTREQKLRLSLMYVTVTKYAIFTLWKPTPADCLIL